MWSDVDVDVIVCVDVFEKLFTTAYCTYDRMKSKIKVIELIHSYKVI